MRHLLLAALLVGTSFAQDKTSPADPPLLGSQTGAAPKQDPNEPQIVVEIRFLTASHALFQELHAEDLIRRAPTPAKTELPSLPDAQLRENSGIQLVSATRVVEVQNPVFVQRIDDQRVTELMAAANANPDMNMLMAPKVTMFNGQEANIKDQVQRPFVVGLKRMGTEFKPQVETLPDGTSVHIRATTKPDAVRLDLAIELSKISDVKTKSAGPANLFIQVPQLSATRIALSALVEDGGTLAVSGLQRTVEVRKEQKVLGMFKNSSVGRETQAMLILITPRIIIPDNKAGRATLDLHNDISQADWCGTPAAYQSMIDRQQARR